MNSSPPFTSLRQPLTAPNITEAAAQTCYNAISTARADINDAATANGDAMVLRDKTLVVMRARLGGLRNELTQLPLPDDSSIWYAFGFNRPPTRRRPVCPTRSCSMPEPPGAAR